MIRMLKVAGIVVVAFVLAGRAAAQESKAAAATRKKLQQKVTISSKEVGIKDFLADLNLEVEKPVRFKIDNATGVSNNMKVSFSGKNVTLEKVLNELSDKFEFGYIVISNAANNKEDGSVHIRKGKGKERGYEDGKEPKGTGTEKQSRLLPAPAAMLTAVGQRDHAVVAAGRRTLAP